MKQKLRLGLVAKKISLTITLFFLSTSLYATSQTGSPCPEKFIATVTNVEDVQSENFPKIEINFQVIQTLKGNDLASKKIQIIKGGPIDFKSGETYTVEFRDRWLCSATLLTKI